MHPQTNVRIRLSFFLLLPVTKRDWYLHNPCLVTLLEYVLTAVTAHVGAKTYLDDLNVHKSKQAEFIAFAKRLAGARRLHLI
jgi:hypothetical protein